MSIKYKNNGTWVESPNTINVIKKPDSKFNSLVDRSITEVTAEDLQGVTKIGGSTFRDCSGLENITIPNNITIIGGYAFSNISGNQTINITFEENSQLNTIGTYAFYNSYGFDSFTIPAGVTIVNAYSFRSVTRCRFIKFLGNITSIGANAFYGNASMQYYDFTNCTEVPSLQNKNAFTNIPSTCEIRVPASLYDQWITATNWSNYASQIVAV